MCTRVTMSTGVELLCALELSYYVHSTFPAHHIMTSKNERPRWDSNPGHNIRTIMTERKCAHGGLSRWTGNETNSS
jgi:hypothetical protein